jgi:alkyl hydroperoxide reductase subunit AhpF
VATDKNGQEKIYETKAVLVASGIHPRELGAKKETLLRGKGVTYCTVCDGPLFKNKTTVTVGAGNSALESALMMSNIAQKVYILTKYPNTPETQGGFPKGETILIQKLKALPNVEVIYSAESKEIVGAEFVEGLAYEDNITKTTHELKVQGVMIHIGSIPNSDFITNVTKNKLKEIEVNLRCETNIPGLFAAGDVTNIPYKQIIIASGQGVTAVLSAIEYLNRWTESA